MNLLKKKKKNQILKINFVLKKNSILPFSNLIVRKESDNNIFLEQKFKKFSSYFLLFPNNIVSTVLLKTLFKNLLMICKGSLFFITNIESIFLKKKLELIDLICLKFFNKIYFTTQLKNIISLKYLINLKVYISFLEKSTMFFYYKTKSRNNVI